MLPLSWAEGLLGWIPDWILVGLVLVAGFLWAVLTLNEQSRRLSDVEFTGLLVFFVVALIGVAVIYYVQGDFWDASALLIDGLVNGVIYLGIATLVLLAIALVLLWWR